MGEIIKIGNNSDFEKVNDEVELVELTEGLLQEARETIKKNEVLSVPISGLATLGTGVAALLPALNKHILSYNSCVLATSHKLFSI